MYKYEISPQLLENIKNITRQIVSVENKKISNPALARYELNAISLSAYSSTSIEGNPLPLTEVKRIIKNRPQQMRSTEREVLNYNDCLTWLNQLLKNDPQKLKFNLKLILQIHQQVMEGLLNKSNSGKIRQEPVFVNNPIQRKTIYWPPDHVDIQVLMKELISFVQTNESKIDPIILAGIFHKQFVIIHPFLDGNGRTVRLATKLLLASLGLNTFHLFSFENYYNRHVTNYFNQVGVLGNYYDIYPTINFTSWLEFFSEGILDELLRINKDLECELIIPQQTLNDSQQKIIEFIKKNGFIRDSDYALLTRRAKATRSLDFKKLIQLEIIEKQGKGPATFYKLKVF